MIASYTLLYIYIALSLADLFLTIFGLKLGVTTEANPLGINAIALLKLITVGVLILLYHYRPKLGAAISIFGCCFVFIPVALWVWMLAQK